MSVTINANGLSVVHKGSGGEANASVPDVCLTKVGKPVVPIPYGNNAKSSDLAGGTTTVTADGGNSIALKGSTFSKSTGDAGGDKKGISSGTIEAEAKFISASPTVFIEGKGVARLSDQMTMNNANTICLGVQNPPVTVTEEEEGTHTVFVKARYPDGILLKEADFDITETSGNVLKNGRFDSSGKSKVSELKPGQIKIAVKESSEDFEPKKVRLVNPHFLAEISDSDFFDIATQGQQTFWQPNRIAPPAASWGLMGKSLIADRYFLDIVRLEVKSHFEERHPNFPFDLLADALVASIESMSDTNMEAVLTTGLPLVLEEGELLSVLYRLPKHETIDRMLAYMRARGKGNPQTYLQNYDWSKAQKAFGNALTSLLAKIKGRLETLSSEASRLNYVYLSSDIYDKHVRTINTYSKKLSENLSKVFERLQSKAENLMSDTSEVSVIQAEDNVYSAEAGNIEVVVNTTLKVDLEERKWIKVCAVYDDLWRTPVYIKGLDVITDDSLTHRAKQDLTPLGQRSTVSKTRELALETESLEGGVLVVADLKPNVTKVAVKSDSEPGIDAQIAAQQDAITSRLDRLYKALKQSMAGFQFQWDEKGYLSLGDGVIDGAEAWVGDVVGMWSDLGDTIPAGISDYMETSPFPVVQKFESDWAQTVYEASVAFDPKNMMVRAQMEMAKSMVELIQDAIAWWDEDSGELKRKVECIIRHREAIWALPVLFSSNDASGIQHFIDTVLMEFDPEWAAEVKESNFLPKAAALINSDHSIAPFMHYIEWMFRAIPPNFYTYYVGKGGIYLILELVLTVMIGFLSGPAGISARMGVFISKLTKGSKAVKKSSHAPMALDGFVDFLKGLKMVLKDYDALADSLALKQKIELTQVNLNTTDELRVPINKRLRKAIPAKENKKKRTQEQQTKEKSDSSRTDDDLAENKDKHQKAEEAESSCMTNTCTGEGEPIDMSTGKAFEERQDLELPGFLPLVHSRYYHSVGRRDSGLLGSLWRSNWDIHLEIDQDLVTFIDRDYSQAVFAMPDKGTISRSKLKPQWELSRTQYGLRLTHSNGQKLDFEQFCGSRRHLSRISDPHQNTLELVYEHATLAWIHLADEQKVRVDTRKGRITQLSLCDREGHELKSLVRYRYDAQGNLTGVRAGEGKNIDYEYSSEGYLTRWQDQAETWVEHDYDAQGRAIATRCAEGYFNDQIAYDDQRLITYYTSAFGGVTEYHRDEKNRIVMIIDPNGHKTCQQWELDNLTAVVDPLGMCTQYQYDAQGNVTEVRQSDGQVHRYQYAGKNQLQCYTDPLGHQWHYAYTFTGQLRSVCDPEQRVWQHEYNAKGLRESTTAPDGSKIHYRYNSHGLLALVGSGPQSEVHFQYDNQYRLLARTTDGKTRRWFYRPHCNTPYQVEYEDGTRTQFSYDKEGNISQITDALGNKTQYRYGAFDKLKSSTDPLGATTQYHYNKEAEFAGVTNSQGQQWLYRFDNMGRVVTERHYDGRQHRFDYDAAGRLTRQIKPDNHRLHYQYHLNGALAKIQSYNAEEQLTNESQFEYDLARRLTRAQNYDAEVELAYNRAGQLTQERVNGQAVNHHYDEAGYPIRREGHDTPLEQQWQHGQLKQLSIGQHTPLRFHHNHLGLETQRESAQGFQLQQQWSQHGQLKQQQLGNQTLRDYHYDALDRIIGINDSHWGNTELTLNPNGQISTQRQIRKDNREQVQLFGYDSELNLNHQASVPATNNVVDLAQKRNEKSHQYDNAGRVLKRGAFSYRYDECGRVVEKTQHKAGYRPQITRFVWNEDDQLIKAELPNQERWRYRYDPFGRRIAKECEQSESINTHYRWDGDNLIGQQKVFADGTPLTSTEYIYEPDSFRPVAQVDTNHLQQTSSLRYIITDHAGTPRELCNEQGDILWRGEQEIWGRHQQRKAANDAIECDLRYQGQIYDRETGLYYNRHRYYDSDSGQYLSSDPIGMAGGLRPQAYVQNPLEWVDPLGLASCPGIETTHKINTGGKAPKTSDPNSIIESQRADGSSSVSYYDEKGRAFSREDYGQQSTHGPLGRRVDGRSVAHEHRFDYNERGFPIKQDVVRELSENGTPAGEWIKIR